MAKGKRTFDWKAIIETVKTPISWFTLIALILDGTLIAVAVGTDKVTIWAPITLLALLIIIMAIIVLRNPDALYLPKDRLQVPATLREMRANLFFQDLKPYEVNLDVDQCRLEIRGRDGRKKPGPYTPNLVAGQGESPWVLRISQDLEPTDSVSLLLFERGGRVWTVGPFAPYERDLHPRTQQ